MASLIDLLRDRVLYGIITLSLGAGLIGAYGRERHEGRAPDRNWWISRACILPFFAIVSTWAADQFRLNNQQSSLLSALLSLMGYEAVRIILERARAKAGAVEAASPPVQATPKPYVSLVDSDEEGRATAHVIVTPEDTSSAARAGDVLRQAYDPSTKAPLDDKMRDALRDLGNEGL